MSSVRARPIQSVVYGVLSANDILNLAVCQVTTPSSKGADTTDTPYDERMGAIDNGRVCLTCHQPNISCVGHYGYIVLPVAVYNPVFINEVVKVLKCVCYNCSKLRINISASKIPSVAKTSGRDRLNTMVKKCSSTEVCPHCLEALPKFTIDNDLVYVYYEDKKKTEMVLSGNQCLSILERISSEDFSAIGFNSNLSSNPLFTREEVLQDANQSHVHEVRPEDFMIVVLCVIPPCSRPYVKRDGENHDDDLTDKYNAILKTIARIQEYMDQKVGKSRGKKNITETEYQHFVEELQLHVWTLIDNKKEKSRLSNGGRPHRSLNERLGKKGGRAQLNVGSKRTDFSSRNVVAGGPSMRSDELGIPLYIAKTLTRPIYASTRTIDFLQTLVNEQRANYVIRRGEKINLKVVTKNGMVPYELKIGDVVERHLMDGDFGAYNRQPSLRKESIQGVKLIVYPSQDGSDYGPWRMPLETTAPFGADFDGRLCLIPVYGF